LPLRAKLVGALAGEAFTLLTDPYQAADRLRSNGLDGRSGFDGAPGPPGAAGTIRVCVDPGAAPFLDRLHLVNRSGNGVAGAAPDLRVEPVAPLW
jgi:hypothetical protein